MKAKQVCLELALCVGLVVPLFVGCRAVEGLLYDKKVEEVPAVVNDEGQVLAPSGLVTNLVAKPVVENAIQVTGAAPIPWAGLASIVLGWAYSSYRSARNKKSAVALVTGVEAVRRILQETEEGRKFDRKLLDIVKEHQVAAGVVSEIGKLVLKHTSPTVTPSKNA